jgi:hypothetical protein
VTATSAWTALLPGFILAGIGIGVLNPVLASATVSVVPPERSGMASGSSSTFRQVGISTGIAGLGAVFLSQIRPNTVHALAQSATGRSILAHGGTHVSGAIAGGDVRQVAASLPPGAVRNTLIDAYRVGFTTTFNHLMQIALVIALVGAVGCFFLVRQRDFVPSYAPGEEPETVEQPAPRYRHSQRQRGRHPAGTPTSRRVASSRATPEEVPAGPMATDWPLPGAGG